VRPDPPARQGRQPRALLPRHIHGQWVLPSTSSAAPHGAVGEAPPRPYRNGDDAPAVTGGLRPWPPFDCRSPV